MPDLIDRAVAWVKSPMYIELTTRQLAILGVVMAQREPVKVRTLAQTLNLAKPVVSRALGALEERGLIERQRGKDRRDRFVHATAAAAAFRAKMGDRP